MRITKTAKRVLIGTVILAMTVSATVMTGAAWNPVSSGTGAEDAGTVFSWNMGTFEISDENREALGERYDAFVDEALADGLITEEQAEYMKNRGDYILPGINRSITVEPGFKLPGSGMRTEVYLGRSVCFFIADENELTEERIAEMREECRQLIGSAAEDGWILTEDTEAVYEMIDTYEFTPGVVCFRLNGDGTVEFSNDMDFRGFDDSIIIERFGEEGEIFSGERGNPIIGGIFGYGRGADYGTRKDQGAEVLDRIKPLLDKAVEAGDMTSEEAAEILARLEAGIAIKWFPGEAESAAPEGGLEEPADSAEADETSYGI